MSSRSSQDVDEEGGGGIPTGSDRYIVHESYGFLYTTSGLLDFFAHTLATVKR